MPQPGQSASGHGSMHSPGAHSPYRPSPTAQFSPGPARGMMANDAASANAVAAMGAAAAAGAQPGAASPAAQQPGVAEPPQATWRHLQMHGSPDGKLTRYDQRPSTLARAPLAGYSQRNVSSM